MMSIISFSSVGQSESVITPIDAIKACNETKLSLDKCEKDIFIFKNVLDDLTRENTLLRLALNEAEKSERTCLELTEKQSADNSLLQLNLDIAKDEVRKYKTTTYAFGGGLGILIISFLVFR